MHEDKDQHATSAVAIAAATANSMDQVRELLFGDFVRTSEMRWQAIESRLDSQQQHLRDEFTAALAALEQTLETALTQLGSELQQADRQQQARHAGLEGELTAVGEQFAARLSQSASDARDEIDGLRTQVQRQIDLLADEATESVRRLGDSKVGREQLAALLGDLAGQLQKAGS